MFLALPGLHAQTGLSNPVNQYGKVEQIFNTPDPSGKDSVIVKNASSIWDGSDLFEIALFIQMKGTEVYDRENLPGGTSFWGKPSDNDFLNNTGVYSVMLVERIVDDSIVIFSSTLSDMDAATPKPVSAQLIKVPYAKSFQLAEDLQVPDWDTASQTGGVLAIFASDKLDLAGHIIDGSNKGFGGGDTARITTDPVSCATLDQTFYLDSQELLAGRRGASIVYHGYPYTRGNNFVLGGGGGGPGRFAGGAGGSNWGQGGRGGAEDKINCSGNEYFGRAFPLNRNLFSNEKNKIFMGAGGGASTPELGRIATPGGDGGGIIIIITDTLAGSVGGETIQAAGQSITDTSSTGGGGGGAGGFIVLDLNHVEGNIHLDISGGKGGDTYDPVLLHGPGGGGGGGVIWHSDSILLPGITADSSGGIAGKHLGFIGDHNAAEGNSGAAIPDLVLPLRGFYFNFISGSEDICQDSTTSLILGSQPKGDTAFVYTWQDSISGGSWTDIPGATGTDEIYKDYAPGILTESTWYRRIVTKTTPPIESDTSISIVEKNVFTRLANNNIASGDTICYNLVPVPFDQDGDSVTGGKTDERIWRWQAWQNSSPGWVDATGIALDGDASRIDYTPGNLLETTYFRRQVISHVCTNISDSLTITVLPDISGNQITGDDHICQFEEPGDSLKGPVPGGGDGLYEYIWQESDNGVDWDSIHTERNYYTGTMDTTTWYRRLVYSGNDRACISISDTVTILVNPIIQQNSIAPNTDVCYLYPAPQIFPDDSIFGGDGSYSYFFQDSIDGGSWILRQSGASGSYDPGGLTDTTWYRRIVVSGACADTSSLIKFQVQPLITGNSISPDYTICAGDSSGIIDGPTPGGGDGSYVYRWDRSLDQVNWTTSDTETTKFLPAKQLSDSTWFRRVVFSGQCVDSMAISVVNAHANIAGNEIWTDSLPKPEACVNLAKLLRGRNENSGLSGGTGQAADFTYLWERYNSQSGLWEDAPALGLSNDQKDYETEVLNTVGEVYTYRRNVESGECEHISDSITFEVKPRPIGSISATAAASACIAGETLYDINVPVVFTGGIGPYTLYYDDGLNGAGAGEKGIYYDLDTSGTFTVSRGTDTASQYIISIDTIMDGNGCWVAEVDGSKEAWIYRDSVPSLLQDTFRVCGELTSIEVIPGLGTTVKGWGPASADYQFSDPADPSTEFTLLNWAGEDFAFRTISWTQKNGVCPEYSVSVVAELYLEPEPASVRSTDTLIFFRQVTPLWANPATAGTGTWSGWEDDPDWVVDGGDPVTDINNPNALADLGGTDNLKETVTRNLTWTVGNEECAETSVSVTIERVDLQTYSAFSPNGDGINDLLILDGLQYAEKFTMQIFSRHGVLVRTVTENDLMPDEYGEMNVVWDAKMENGNDAEDGTYFYMIEVEHAGQKYQYKNYLELVRADPNQ